MKITPQQSHKAKTVAEDIKMDEIFAEADAAMERVNEKNIKETEKYAKQK